MSHLTSGISEAQRCINNLLLQSPVARNLICASDALTGLLGLTMTWRDLVVSQEMLTVDLKLLFLITALCPETR